MSAIKDNDRKTWRAYIRYTDWQRKNQIHTKRGFKTKREALTYEREFLMKKTRDVNRKANRECFGKTKKA